VNAKRNTCAPLVVVWAFRVLPDNRPEFEIAYGPQGLWAQLFRKSDDYIRTELHSDTRVEGLYFTLDFWRSRAAFCDFKERNLAAYKSLDERCSSLTTDETFLAEYETLEQVSEFLASHGLPCTKVRPASPADVPAMLALEKSSPSAAHWSESGYKAMFDPSAPERIALVLQDSKQQVQGFAVARIAGDECELENIVVQESSRRSGYGRMLLHTIIASACVQGLTRILLEVRESNQAARRFYENLGFELTGRRSYYANPTEDALMYELTL
jgi:ribosomal-protein-alanine N-acetyltransferase